MDLFKGEIVKIFKFHVFKKSFRLTWLFTGIGLILLVVFIVIAGVMPVKSYYFFFFRNAGIYLFTVFLLIAFSGVYRITSYPFDADRVTRNSIRDTFKNLKYIIGITLLTLFALLAIVLVETGFVYISYIPYVGPIIVAILTAPFFLLNIFCIIITICIFVIAPPLIGEYNTLPDVKDKIGKILHDEVLNIILFFIISLSVFFLSMVIIYFIMKYTASITMTLQWKINSAYPKFFIDNFSMQTYINDIIKIITPSAQKISSPGFAGLVRNIVIFSYLVIFSFVISFPLAIYFSFSSIFFRSMFIIEE